MAKPLISKQDGPAWSCPFCGGKASLQLVQETDGRTSRAVGHSLPTCPQYRELSPAEYVSKSYEARVGHRMPESVANSVTLMQANPMTHALLGEVRVELKDLIAVGRDVDPNFKWVYVNGAYNTHGLPALLVTTGSYAVVEDIVEAWFFRKDDDDTGRARVTSSAGLPRGGN